MSPSSVEPAPNQGASVNAKSAIHDQQGLNDWRAIMGIDTTNQVKLVKLSHMRYQHNDFTSIVVFLQDFGMHIVKKTANKIWFAGYGNDQFVYVAEKGLENKFIAGAYTVESEADLERAAKIPGAGVIETLDDAPGGGKRITITDPAGFLVDLIHGQSDDIGEGRSFPEKLIYNYESEKSRVGQFQRFKDGPAAVHKLGHYGLCVTNFEEQWKFYTKHFNLVPTDWLYVEDGGKKRDVALFAHIDRGDDYVDHHTFFMSSNPTAHVHHCSFEVHDFDTQLLGHKWLASRGYKSVWGVGRHVLGSQIFDYWWDTSNFMVEHYADGDLINRDTPIGRMAAGDESLAIWGPDVPTTFLD